VRGYRATAAALPLVVVGGAPYSDGYTAAVRGLADRDPRVRLLGPVWDQDLLNQLYGHARLYLHGHSVGGTNPSLLRAMGAGTPVAAYDVRFNRDVVGDDGWYFADGCGVARVVEAAERHPASAEAYAQRLQRRVVDGGYQWQSVADGYEALARRLAAGYSRRGEVTDRRNPARTTADRLDHGG
jgi:glycosyltransferase involved in cell wall biosynthesis